MGKRRIEELDIGPCNYIKMIVLDIYPLQLRKVDGFSLLIVCHLFIGAVFNTSRVIGIFEIIGNMYFKIV